MVTLDGTNPQYINITDLGDDLSFGQPFTTTVDDQLFVLDNEDYIYSDGLFWNDLFLRDITNNAPDNSYLFDLSDNYTYPYSDSSSSNEWNEFLRDITNNAPDNSYLFDISDNYDNYDNYIDENALDEAIKNSINAYRNSIDDYISNNSITLEVTNTQDTSIIDESDGLSLGEAIQIASNDPENIYVIEIPGGSTYNTTVTENFGRVGNITLRGTGDGVAEVNGIREGESVFQYQIDSGSSVSFFNHILPNNDNNNNTDANTG